MNGRCKMKGWQRLSLVYRRSGMVGNDKHCSSGDDRPVMLDVD